MPSSKSSRSSKGARPSLLSLSSRSVSSLFSTSSSPREYMGSLGQPVKELPDLPDGAVAGKARESEGKPQRRKSKLDVLTSLFSPTSPVGSTKKLSASASDSRPKTAHEVLPTSHLREKAVVRKPVASTVEFNNHRKSSSDFSRNTRSVHNASISTVDDSPQASAPALATPSTQVSDLEFNFGVERTQSPETAENLTDNMPAVIQKHQRGLSAPDPAPQRAPPPPPPKDFPPRDATTAQAPDMHDPTEAPRSRGSEGSSSSSQTPASASKADGRTRLQSTRRPSPAAAPRMRSSSAQPSLYRGSTADHSRTVSTPVEPRAAHDGDGRGRLRRSWLPGGRSSSASKLSKELKKMPPNKAWIMSPDGHADYNTTLLMNGDRVS